MDEALAQANRVPAVLSPAYLRSEYARDEWTAALVRERGQTDRLLLVRVAACQLPPLRANRIGVSTPQGERHVRAELAACQLSAICQQLHLTQPYVALRRFLLHRFLPVVACCPQGWGRAL